MLSITYRLDIDWSLSWSKKIYVWVNSTESFQLNRISPTQQSLSNSTESFQLKRVFPTQQSLSNSTESFQLNRVFPTQHSLSNSTESFQLNRFFPTESFQFNRFFPTQQNLSNSTSPTQHHLRSSDVQHIAVVTSEKFRLPGITPLSSPAAPHLRRGRHPSDPIRSVPTSLPVSSPGQPPVPVSSPLQPHPSVISHLDSPHPCVITSIAPTPVSSPRHPPSCVVTSTIHSASVANDLIMSIIN